MTLPNNTGYTFQYNIYGEVARLTLPTGGAIEYDHSAGVAANGYSGFYPSGQILDSYPSSSIQSDSAPGFAWHPVIYRRVRERRVYANLEDNTPASTTTYAQPESASQSFLGSGDASNRTVAATTTSQMYVQEQQTDPALSNSTITTNHYFYTCGAGGIDEPCGSAQELLFGSGSAPFLALATSIFNGKEFKTELPGLQRVEQVWSMIGDTYHSVQLCQVNTTHIAGSSSLTRSKVVYYDSLANVTDTYEYGYGNAVAIGTYLQTVQNSSYTFQMCPGDPYLTDHSNTAHVVPLGPSGVPVNSSRHTQTTFDASLASSAHIYSLPSTTTLSDSTGTLQQTNYYYDQETGQNICSYSPGFGGGTPAYGHDSSYGSSYTTRGNLNCIARWLNSSPTPQWLTTTYKYDVAGNVVLMTDPRGNATQTSYADNCNMGLPYQVTNALSQTISVQYNCYIAKPSQITDVNNNTTTLSYADAGLLDRLQSFTEAGVRRTTFAYHDTAPPSVDIAADRDALGDHVLNSTIQYDGFGRKTSSILYGDSSAVVSRTDTQYDGIGRVWKVSNPAAGPPTDWTTTAYDALGRVLSVTHPDSSVAYTSYALASDTDTATVTDEAGVQRVLYHDALGRLSEVQEVLPAGSTPSSYATMYGYDGRDNLTSVTHVNQNNQLRSFQYDSLNRLTQASNPETNIVSYRYDQNGNVTMRCFGTSNSSGQCSGKSTGMSYDAVNRVSQKLYSDGTPTVTYRYDSYDSASAVCNANQNYPSDSQNYPVGRLTEVSNNSSSSRYECHDKQGRPTRSSQVPNGRSPYTFYYQYNLAGGLTEVRYPSGRTITTAFDSANRASTLTGSYLGNGAPYITGIQYAPQGAPCQTTLNNGSLVEQTAFNNRLQPTVIRQRTQAGGCGTAGSSNASDDVAYLSLQYYNSDSTKNNGNLWHQTEVFGGLTFNQSYTYDGVNRLQQATETGPGSGWIQTYGYDAVGNRWVTDYPNLAGWGMFVPGSAGSFDTVNNNNRLLVNGSLFDNGTGNGSGNLTAIGGYQYTYDGENRMVSSHLNSSTTYVYDGEGHRVQKVDAGGTTTEYVYDGSGKVAAEYTIAGTAPAAPCGTCYLMADHLGSTRMMTDAALSNGVVQVRAFHDYLPFGEEIVSGTGSWDGRDSRWGVDDPKWKFTGKERDQSWESGLDYFGARYFSGPQGRFTSTDPIAMTSERLVDPQRLNMYAYARNNPLKYIDPKGEDLDLSQLSEEDREKLIAALQKRSGLQLNYNSKSGLLEIAGRGKGGSASYREGLTALIGDKRTFNVLNQSEVSSNGQTLQVGFGKYDPKTNNIIIDFRDFSPKQPEMDLGLVFYHEGVAHGEKGYSDEGSWNAVLDTLKVADELGLPAPVTHDAQQQGDRYFLRIGSPRAPNAPWYQGRDTKLIDVTDSMKPREKK